ncbi:hypothetical protein SteCoe_12274 [Stentor coeruleus]|uniref:Uncharacterized protein n=1 Tax=Stentor coeruleus TaxID=5963 RepID=A0A1R2CBB6_9CILI|nr:hypothetical protein SteCoe_12274 [Stentor coeruleus]
MVNLSFDRASFISKIFMGWVAKSVFYYRKNPPTLSNLFEIPANYSLESNLKTLKDNWNEELKKKEPSFTKATIKTIKVKYFISALLMILAQCQGLIQATLINYLVKYLMNDSAPKYEGALLTFAFIVSVFVSACCQAQVNFRSSLLIGNLKNIITILITEKVLKLSSNSLSDEKIRGKILNTLSTDMELLEMTNFTLIVWCTPFVILFSIIIVSYTFGPVGIIGIGISIIHIPLVIIIGKAIQGLRSKANILGDFRIKMIENLIEGIKIMKLYAWEIPFLDFIYKKRLEEYTFRSRISNLNTILLVLSFASISFEVFITLLVQVKLGRDFTIGSVFLLITIYFSSHIIIVYTNTFGINTLFVFFGVMKRVGEILLMKEFKKDFKSPLGDLAICMTDATLSWREESAGQDDDNTQRSFKRTKSIYRECIQNMSFVASKKELIMVVGPVGSGKTSLLMGLLGEIYITVGKICLDDNVAYATNDSWIISGSIKENILMGRTLDPEFYTEVINSCALIKDLEILSNGDETVIGDRGTTLSGGQKARICLARAVYSDANIFLLDDPLSAVDPEVANYIFDHCIRGILKDKTVILVTHQVQFMSQADNILVLNGGSNLFYGSYKDLKKREDVKQLIGDYAFRKSEKTKKKVKQTVVKEENKEKEIFEEQEITEGKAGLKIYWRYFLYGYKNSFIVFLIFCLIVICQVIYQACFYWISFWSKQDDQSNNYYIGVLGVLVGIYFFTFSLRNYSIIKCNLRSNIQLHNEALKSVALTDSLFFDKNPTGRIINRFSKDIGAIDGPLQAFAYESINAGVLIISNIIVAIIVMPYTTIIIPFAAIIIICIFKYGAPVVLQLKKFELIARGPILTTITSCLNGLPTIRCLNLQEKFLQDIKNYTEIYFRAHFTFYAMLRTNTFYSEIGFSSIVILNVILLISLKGTISPSLAAYSLSSTISLLGIGGFYVRNVIEMTSYMTSAQRLIEYVDIPREGEFITDSNFQVKKGKIKFDNVFMKYRPNLPYSLAGLSFTVKGGHKVGIIGRTGAGKSSLLQVLFRLVNPELGTIFIDGVDYLQLGLHDLRKQMSVIPQAATLFTGSIRDNLDPFHFYSDDEILNSLEDVQLKDKILELHEGLNSEIGNEGLSLSAGQKQLLCMARAILRKNKVIMMDEATANVDNETDRIIQETIANKFEGCTLLVIAHRIRTIIHSDKVLVMDKGKCHEYDRPKKLYLNENSLFRQMISHTGPEESSYLVGQLGIDDQLIILDRN